MARQEEVRRMRRSSLQTSNGGNGCCWLTIVFLILTHNVWNSLQCSSSSSHERQARIVPKPNNELLSSELIRLSSTSSEKPNLIFTRDTRRVGNCGSPDTIQACSRRLKYLLLCICDGQIYQPNAVNEDGSGGSLTRRKRVLPRRVPRAVVNECCTKSCSMKYLERFCRDGPQEYIPDNNSTEEFTQIQEQPQPNPPRPRYPQPLTSSSQQPRPPPPKPDHAYTPFFIHILKYLLSKDQHQPGQHQPGHQQQPEPEERTLPIPEFRVQQEEAQQQQLPPPQRSEYPTVQQLIIEEDEEEEDELYDPPALHHHGAYHPPASYYPASSNPNRDLNDDFPNQIDIQSPSLLLQNGNKHNNHGRHVGLNAVTSTFPPMMFPVGSLKNDYAV